MRIEGCFLACEYTQAHLFGFAVFHPLFALGLKVSSHVRRSVGVGNQGCVVTLVGFCALGSVRAGCMEYNNCVFSTYNAPS